MRSQMDEREKQSWRELGELQRQLEDASASSADADVMKRRVAELVKQRGADQVTSFVPYIFSITCLCLYDNFIFPHTFSHTLMDRSGDYR